MQCTSKFYLASPPYIDLNIVVATRYHHNPEGKPNPERLHKQNHTPAQRTSPYPSRPPTARAHKKETPAAVARGLAAAAEVGFEEVATTLVQGVRMAWSAHRHIAVTVALDSEEARGELLTSERVRVTVRVVVTDLTWVVVTVLTLTDYWS